MRIKKTSQTTSTQAQVVDGYSTSTTDSPSCNYVNNINTYSTGEIRVGTWIDGKPIYKKVMQTTNITFNDYTFLTIDNNTNLIKYEVYIRRNNNRLDKYATGTTVENASLVSSIRSNGIELWTDSVYQTGFIELYAIIEYTKTTD